MKLGVISDVHGDFVALELAWAQLTVLGVDRIVCAGDVVGYGPHPDRVIAFLKEHEIPTVRGNHDRWAIDRGPDIPDPYGGGTPDDATVEFLETLEPFLLVPHGHRVGVVVHGSPTDDMEFITRRTHAPYVLDRYLEQLNADFLIVGHTHEPSWYHGGRGLVLNPGAVISAPVVKTSRTFAVLDVETLEATFHDVESGQRIDVAPWNS